MPMRKNKHYNVQTCTESTKAQGTLQIWSFASLYSIHKPCGHRFECHYHACFAEHQAGLSFTLSTQREKFTAWFISQAAK